MASLEPYKNYDTHVVVCPVGSFRDHHVGSHARHVGLIGKCDQIEHETDLLVERVLFPDSAPHESVEL